MQSHADIDAAFQVGGIAGRTNGGIIADSLFSGTLVAIVSGGGIVGRHCDATIRTSVVTGAVQGSPDADGIANIGGIVGRFTGTSHIIDSIFSGNVSGGQAVGGAVGSHIGAPNSTVENVMVVGRTNSTETVETGSTQTGGLVGYMGWEGDVIGSFVTGPVKGGIDTNLGQAVEGGAIAGQNRFGEFVDCWFSKSVGTKAVHFKDEGDTDIVESIRVANNVPFFQGSGSANRGPMANWDFDTIWEEVPNGFPRLRWQAPQIVVAAADTYVRGGSHSSKSFGNAKNLGD